MSVEKIAARAVLATAACKIGRELASCGAGIFHSIGETCDEIANAVLMVEQHFGRRYEDVTGVNLAGLTPEPQLYRGEREEQVGVEDVDDEE